MGYMVCQVAELEQKLRQTVMPPKMLGIQEQFPLYSRCQASQESAVLMVEQIARADDTEPSAQ
jgi:hypothetical protein